jgi:hypothetical protein
VYLAPLKTLLTEAVLATFDADYPEEQFRNLWASLEYPAEESNYPGIWVDFTPTADIQTAGIGHEEHVETDDGIRILHRWRYAGTVQLTVVALTSLERDRLVDEVVKVVAFGPENAGRADFRDMVEHSDLIEMRAQWDKLSLGGKAETPGTPWQTDEMVYEMTVSLDCFGSFVSDGTDAVLVPLSRVAVYEAPTGEVPVDSAGQPPADGDGWT